MDRETRKGLQHDGLVDAVSTGAAHFQTHSRAYIAAGAVLAILVLILAVFLYRRSASQSEAARLLNSARSSAALEEIVEKYPATSAAPLALLSLADFCFRQGELEAAQGRYDLFLKSYPEHESAAFAQMGIGYCLESRGQLAEALAAYRLVEGKFSGSSLGAEALFNAARVQNAQGVASDALITYGLIVSQYPQSAFASSAREAMARLSGGGAVASGPAAVPAPSPSPGEAD